MSIGEWTSSHVQQPAYRDQRARERRPEWIENLPTASHELSAGSSRNLGEEPELLFVTHGRLIVSALDEKGDEILSMLRGPGSVIAMERLNEVVVSYQLWALTDVRYQSIELSKIKLWLDDAINEPARSLVMSAVDSAGACIRERTTLHGRVLVRVAKFLIDSCEGDSALRIPRFIMARILAMRPETLSRALKELERRGGIALKPRLRVASYEALRQIITEH